MILRGKPVANRIYEEIKSLSQKDKDFFATLACVRIGENADDIAYETSIEKKCKNLNIKLDKIKINPKDEDTVVDTIKRLNESEDIDGILVFRPFQNKSLEQIVSKIIDKKKDVDGINGENPCTPLAVLELIDYYNIDIKNKNITILGRGKVVGVPLKMLLENRGANISVCHSKTTDTKDKCLNADIIISAVGKEKLVTKDMVRSKQIVIDVGINTRSDGLMVGDVDFDNVANVVESITPVPGGVGSITTAVLLKKVVRNYLNERQKIYDN